jgi:tripartite-type tricarboxylate transporter receptor subunit TctC
MVKLFSAAVAACLCSYAGTTLSQAYPVKPIMVKSGHPIGSSGETALRLITPKMAELLGQPLVVETKGGAGGSIAANTVAKSAPDGYTVLSIGAGGIVSRQFLVKNVPYDALKDFTPIGQFAKAVTFLVVHDSVPATTLRELIEVAKREPGKLTYGSTGVGSPFHIMGESIKLATGINIRHVPYNAGQSALAQNDLLAGTIKMYFPSYTVLRQFVDSGKIRVLAVTDAQRYKRQPNVPTVSEIVPGFRKAPSWNGLLGPAGLPQPILKRLSSAMNTALDVDEIEQKMDAFGLQPVGNSPEEFAKALKEEIHDFGEMAKKLGLQAQ